jgi:hypothetical protein
VAYLGRCNGKHGIYGNVANLVSIACRGRFIQFAIRPTCNTRILLRADRRLLIDKIFVKKRESPRSSRLSRRGKVRFAAMAGPVEIFIGPLIPSETAWVRIART